jgi:hypothetical protein
MAPHSSAEDSLSWDVGIVNFVGLHDTLSEAVSGYAHIYACGEEKCRFLTNLLAQPIQNLED